MKTCSFRQAKRRSLNEGLFCVDEPYAQYSFLPCNKCSLCIPRYHLSCREKLGSMIRFNLIQPFTFSNGYKILLNCPVNCQTRNLIYVMICPCRKFEYIGETSQRLSDRLRCKFIVFLLLFLIFNNFNKNYIADHRQHFNRIFHEFLLGEQNIQLNRIQDKDQE